MTKSYDQQPVKTGADQAPASPRAEIDAFLAQVRGMGPAVNVGTRGRLVFAMDATMSRQPTWDSACSLQADMFREAASIGGLDIQLVYFRGLNECRSSGFVSGAEKLGQLMSGISCQGGHTQIGKVLLHAKTESAKGKVAALVFVGDAMEEAVDHLCALAGELGLRGVPAFMFQEGGDPIAEQAYREIARLSRGAYARFDTGAAHELGELLRAVAAYAAGGMRALSNLSARDNNAGARRLIAQMK
jgi:hypothetical protein